MALIDDEPRSATAIAATDVELVSVSEKQFLFLVSQTPYFALKVMRILAQRLRKTNKTLGWLDLVLAPTGCRHQRKTPDKRLWFARDHRTMERRLGRGQGEIATGAARLGIRNHGS
jgi:CRP-like cAMP-binding protein